MTDQIDLNKKQRDDVQASIDVKNMKINETTVKIIELWVQKCGIKHYTKDITKIIANYLILSVLFFFFA